VLVVEDDDNLRELVSLALLDEGYQVAAARNGADGLERLREHQPDVILLDVQMPVMDGPTFAEHYRRMPPPHAPIVVYTAAGSARRWAERIRAAACLDKPFDLHAVSALLAHCARASQTSASAG
jgi:CheY-like chemotaxis protein